MVTKKVVGTLGVLAVSSIGLLACEPGDGASVTTKGGLEAECLTRECLSGGGGFTFNGGETTKPKTYSYCEPVTMTGIENAGESKFVGNERLVMLVADANGNIPCVNPQGEKNEVVGCKFDKEIAAKAGIPLIEGWMRSANGEVKGLFIPAGTTINQDGSQTSDEKGNRYGSHLIATKVRITTDLKTGATKGYVPCVAPGGSDVAGTAASSELAAACIVEVANLLTNASGTDHQNFCQLQACARSNNDAVSAGTAKSATVTCWKGQGAGLNDVNGTERNDVGVYLTTANSCHRLWSGGYEVAAAKRVLSIGYAPPKPVESSDQAWRAVAVGMSYGNP